ncbi:tripartite tricarboxylate transporter TctB family protein [Ramlibacter sp. G-1-2-2]|uniref:Tripartite tricarboxylate transporter TctB family protein n=2 Tax=Ramlibacter agri TaxID=2728837 RepID=A0A848GZQ2_9BURK|nr:tripartite tricarboxylate transporter TctB family protein [Ramlibacter agri]
MLSRRSLEISTAATLAAFAGAVIAGALQLDTGWASTGPQSGYVPLRLGAMLLAVSLLLLVQAARTASPGTFATREQLARCLALLLPTLVMVFAMAWLGTYLTAAVYLAFMARRHGGLGWGRAAALGLVASVVTFLTFELWFGVPLAKGPIETWLGY